MNTENKNNEIMTKSTNQGITATFFKNISAFINGEDAQATEIKIDLSQTTNNGKTEEIKQRIGSDESYLIVADIKLMTLEILLVFVQCIKTIILWVGVIIYTILGWEAKLNRNWLLNSTSHYNNPRQ